MPNQLLSNVYHIQGGQALPLTVSVRNEQNETANQSLYELGRTQFEKSLPFIKINSIGCLQMGKTIRLADVYYDVKRDLRWVAVPLPHLHFKTMYALDEEGFEVPSFPPSSAGSLAAVAMMAEDMYEVPLNLFEDAGWYVYTLLDVRTTEIYILAISKTECMLLPIPNQYDSGKMCMGASFDPGVGGMLERIDNTVQSFLASLWNRDLYTDYKKERMEALFKFKDGVYRGLSNLEGSAYDYIKSNMIQFGPNQALNAVIEEIQRGMQ